MVLWSVDTDDYLQPGVSAIVQRALAGAHPGAIILMHDAGGTRTQTIEALPVIIRRLRARGFRLVTVPELLRDDPPPAGTAATVEPEWGLMDIEQLRTRREERRRAIRRRRRLTVGLIAAVAVLVAAIVVLARATSGPSGQPRHHGHTAGLAGHHGRPGTRGARHGARAARDRRSGRRPAGDRPRADPHVPRDRRPSRRARRSPGCTSTPAEFAEQMQALAGRRLARGDARPGRRPTGVAACRSEPASRSWSASTTATTRSTRRRSRCCDGLGWVGDENLQLTGLPPSQGGLGPGQIRGLLAAGWELDTQGISHADLITLDAEQLHYQVAVARRTLQRRYHVPVNWFCYPSGHYDPTVRRRREGGRLRRLDDRRPWLGAPERGPLSPASPARARRHERAVSCSHC